MVALSDRQFGDRSWSIGEIGLPYFQTNWYKAVGIHLIVLILMWEQNQGWKQPLYISW